MGEHEHDHVPVKWMGVVKTEYACTMFMSGVQDEGRDNAGARTTYFITMDGGLIPTVPNCCGLETLEGEASRNRWVHYVVDSKGDLPS
jgi:hypothetical protein